jgi:hypothetical protein
LEWRVLDATYKLAKQFGGFGHYAEVRVVIDAAAVASIEVAPDVFAWLKDVYGADAWEWPVCDDYRAGAMSGCQHAIDNVSSEGSCPPVRVVITRIHGHPAHTSAKDVAFAACHATWKALGVEGRNPPDIA